MRARKNEPEMNGDPMFCSWVGDADAFGVEWSGGR